MTIKQCNAIVESARSFLERFNEDEVAEINFETWFHKYGVEISENDYEVLKPFFQMFKKTTYQWGDGCEMSFETTMEVCTIHLGGKMYVCADDKYALVCFFVQFRQFICFLREMYKKVPYNKTYCL